MNRDTFTPPDLSDALLQRMPLFPLPSAVLYPHSVIPLHCFEERYRVLARDCVEGARVMALGTLVAADEDEATVPPAVHPVVTIGAIAASRRLPDGRWDIALKGLCRAEIIAEQPSDAPYRLVHVRRLRDRERAEDRLQAGALRSAVVQVANRLPALWPQLSPQLLEARTPGALADVVAGLFVDDAATRRALLGELRVGERIETLTGVIAGILLDLALRSAGADPIERDALH
jgi:Lon protease-like protein